MTRISTRRAHTSISVPYTPIADQDQVRDKSAGRGLLFPDTFREERLLFAPAVISTLLQIDEFKKWFDPPPTDTIARAIQDEGIFQTAMLTKSVR
ncbi:hypothetical protein H0H81_011501 [Sphagnurus paluster]|uniref:Uncharacterized protein n=1 Tax=Sphagnurus paluster TaxID=117069 RepID=A0A9P7K8B2_9AGAR|nr:hypothetical protein H0H81_011501 [Sphagnurus paluster]